MFKNFINRGHSYKDPERAVLALREIYENHVNYLREQFRLFVSGKIPVEKVQAFYPYIRFEIENATRSDSRLSYGFVAKPGIFETTVSRPDIFGNYYINQLAQMIRNHNAPAEIGVSQTPIPIHFALGEDFYVEADLGEEQLKKVPYLFDIPDLGVMDDQVANGTYPVVPGQPMPLSLFAAPRVDLSLMRLRHYTGTNAEHFQNFVLFTNYQFYIDEFCRIGRELMTHSGDERIRGERSQYSAFVEPGNKVTLNENLPGARNEKGADVGLSRLPQMPAYHLKRPDLSGITMINIGVGPSNAKTITDHVAVLRPHAWIMLGHCAGLRNSQNLGDYVLAHGYLREDNVLYRELHPSIPIPALSEIQLALEQSVGHVTGLQGYDLKKIMRTGTVATVADRNWEFSPSARHNSRLSQSRAIAADMESGTIAANGFRFRVPYGTLLCVSDRPLHGQLKLPGMAESFYRNRVEQHLRIGLRAMDLLRDIGPEKLHSRKLRSFNEVAFQ